MTILHSIILGLVQGLTEFIPISSSGHLIIVREWLNINTDDGLAFDAVLQLATAFAVLLYFYKDIINVAKTFIKLLLSRETYHEERVLFTSLFIATIPAVLAGVMLERYMETYFRSSALVAMTLIFGSMIMFLAEFVSKKRGYDESLNYMKALSIGLFQCLALVPGVSRSGATISGGLFSGLAREKAIRFSFLLSFPILFGSGLKKLSDIVLDSSFVSNFLPLIIGSMVAFVVGILSIHFLIKYLQKHSLMIFVWYRIILAGAMLVWLV